MSRQLIRRQGRVLVPAILLFSLACAGTDRAVKQPRPEPIDPEELLLRKAEILRAEDRRAVDPELLTALGYPAPLIREMALRTIGYIGDASVRDKVEPVLRDPDPGVRAQAAFTLGLLGDPASLPALNSLAQDANPRVRAGLAAAYAVFGDPDTRNGLLELLGDPDPFVVTAGCNALANVEDGSFAIEALISLSASDQPSIAVAATRALGQLASGSNRLDFSARRSARERLVEMADSRNPEIRAAVAHGLLIPGGVGEADALLLLVKDDDPRVRISALHSFSFPGSPIGLFFQEALVEKDDRIALAAVQGLGRMRGPDVIGRLSDLAVFDERVWLKAAAIAEMRDVDPDNAAALSNGFSNFESASVREVVPRLLVGRDDAPSIEYATRLYGDDVPAVRRAAIPALAGAPGSLAEVLEGPLESTDPLDRARVAEAAGWRLADKERSDEERREAFAILARLWDESQTPPEATILLAVMDAARRAGADPAAKSLLDTGLGASDRRVRERAAAHLQTVFGETRSSHAADLPIEHYLEIIRWTEKSQAVIISVEREGFLPGRFTVLLNTQAAPLTSWNFVQLANAGFYTGQAVDALRPTVSVAFGGSSNVTYPDAELVMRNEPVANWFPAGTIAMRQAQPGSAGLEWFVSFVDQPQLVGAHTPFGRVVQNLSGVVFRFLPGDRIVKIEPYEGTGSEPLPAL